MLDHFSIGVADLDRSKQFYDTVLEPLGYQRLSDGKTAAGYGADSAGFWVLAAQHPVSADLHSGLHFCFKAPTRQSVDEFHRAALSAGARDNGGPGIRTEYAPNYYAAFVIDPDGYRIEAYCAVTS